MLQVFYAICPEAGSSASLVCVSHTLSVLRAARQPVALAHGGPLHSAPLVLATTLKQDFCKHAECWALQKTGSVFCDSIIQHIQWEHSTNIGRVVLGISVFISFIPSIYPFIYTFSSVAQSCLTLCNPINNSMPGLPVHHQLPESTQTHVHRVGDAMQPSHLLSSPSPPALNLSQHQGLFK